MKRQRSIVPWSVVLAVLALVASAPTHAATRGQRVGPRAELTPGHFTWHPETSPTGPVLVVVSLPQQQAYVYRNGVLIGRSTISSGREGKETPTGVFTVLQKKAKHESNIYKGAPMPNMQRLTWTGIALHAGTLPGRPASAGCVRLPLEFSRLLFQVTKTGTTVVVADDASDSALVAHPGALMATPAVMKQVEPGDVVGSGWTWHPERAPKGPVSIVVSGSDRQVWVFRNGEPLGRAALELDAPASELPRGVFSYVGLRNGKRRWVAAGLDAAAAGRTLDAIRDRVRIAPEFLTAVQDVLRPGDTLVVTPASVVPPSVAAAPLE
jgi:L,D-transpeptidase catalytic domain